MAVTNYINVLPESFTFDNVKFCFPKPLTLTGTFSTTPNTFAINALIVDPLNPNKAIATVTAGHGIIGSARITIAGAVEDEYNGWVLAEALTPTTFTYWFAGTSSSPATGTIIGDRGGCTAIGVDTIAKEEFAKYNGPNIFIYVPALNAIRQVSRIINDTQWEFFEDFPSNVAAGTPILCVNGGVYNSISAITTDSGDGIFLEDTLAQADPEVRAYDINGLAPVCGDATGTIMKVTTLRRLGQ